MNKNFPRRDKKGFREFFLNSKKGVKTPRWRILGTKKYYLYSCKINFARY